MQHTRKRTAGGLLRRRFDRQQPGRLERSPQPDRPVRQQRNDIPADRCPEAARNRTGGPGTARVGPLAARANRQHAPGRAAVLAGAQLIQNLVSGVEHRVLRFAFRLAPGGVLKHRCHKQRAPSTRDIFLSNVPTGMCPALRATSTTRQSENPTARALANVACARRTTSSSCRARRSCSTARRTPRRGRPVPDRRARSGGRGRSCQSRAWVRRTSRRSRRASAAPDLAPTATDSVSTRRIRWRSPARGTTGASCADQGRRRSP